MADKQISSLPAATSVDDNSLFVVEQQGAAMSASGALWKGFAVDTVQPYATAASGSATAAATSATNAAASAQAAQNSADSISGSVETAQQAAQEAAQSAQQAASSASGVAESAEAAASSAQQATQASQNASSAQAAAESASEDAQAASTSAGQSATQAQSSASAAQQSAASASASATTAQQQAQAAQSSASAAATSAIAAGEAQEAIENLGVSAETLPTGSAATVTKSVVDGIVQLLFGLPTGATGARGIPGNSIQSITRTSGNGAPGTVDTYTVTLTDGSVGGTFQVYNGADGTGTGDFMANGSVPMSGALQMGGNRITNVGAPTADTDAVRQSDLKAVSDEVDKILDGTTPVAIPAATNAKIGGVIVGEGLSVEANGTISADSQLPEGGTTGQILTKTADGEAWANPPDTGVTTFNGRTGAVTPQTGDYTADMVGARASDWTPTAEDVGAVPTTRTVNGKALSADITLGAGDVGARPSTWTPNATDVGAIPAGQKGAAGGVAELDGTGRVPSTQLPSYVDDVAEYASLSNFPQTGEDGKIYIAEDTNLTYRWSGSQYVEISPSLALGETSSTAYRGDRGKTAYDHSQTTGNPHNTTANEVGALPIGGGTLTGPLTLSGNPTSTNQAASKGYVDSAVSNAAPLTFANVSVTTSMTWGTHSIAALNDAGYTRRVTVPLSGVTVNHSPDVRLSAADMYSGNWASYADTYAGGLYLYAKEAAAITIPLVIFTAD